jgi:hypothetical protein
VSDDKKKTGGEPAPKEHAPKESGRDYRIPAKSAWAGAWKGAAVVGALGLLGAAYGYKVDPQRFAFAYLWAFYVSLSLALGSLFFVMVQYITKASWGVTVRRTAEMFMRPMSLFPVLAIPLVLLVGQLFPWTGAKRPNEIHKEAAAATAEKGADKGGEKGAANKETTPSPIAEARGIADREPAAMRDPPLTNARRMERAEERAEGEIVAHKAFFFKRGFFFTRFVLYLLIWWWLAQRFFGWSTDQDKTKALELTAAAQRFAPAGLILFAITITFFAFDWLLSLSAGWYSTIFGVQIFAQCALFNMATLILMTLLLRRSGLLGDAVNVEHYHDMGKLLFGWIVFWSYISFAQFFLTWYSNIPDELSWFHLRWEDNGGTWKGLGLALIALHFFVPFWFLMSRNIKRRLPLLAIGAVCMVCMHVAEAYWLIMPNYGPMQPSWIDAACLVGVFGVYLATVLYGMQEHALIPVGDPRLTRALEFENA